MNNPQPKSVIIVGGSLAGLMHALVLLSLPHPPAVRILERSPGVLLHDQGAGVVAGGDTIHFFNEYVRPGRKIAVTSPMRHYLDKTGAEIPQSVEHRAQLMTSWDLLYNLLKWRVDGLASKHTEGLQPDSRPKAQYENGCTVTSIEDVGPAGLKITYDHKDLGQGQTAVADMVIAADGASSTIRRLLSPNIERKYAGYVAWRGTVQESRLSSEAQDAFVEKFTFFHSGGIQSLAYLIPGRNGLLEKGQRLLNWVWYCNHRESSPELEQLMTDVHGRRHAVTLPIDTMKPEVWEKQKTHAADVLPPQFAEAVAKTEHPFVQAITDNISDQNRYFDGKLLLVGDALAGFRPHTAASTSQAALNALTLGWVMQGHCEWNDYDEHVMEYARQLQRHGVMLGDRSQFGKHPMSGS